MDGVICNSIWSQKCKQFMQGYYSCKYKSSYFWHCKSKYYALSIFSLSLFNQRVKSEGAQRPPFHLPSLSPMRRNQSCSHSPPTHNHTRCGGEIYCQCFSQTRVLELLLVKMSLLFSYWCVGLYQWGGRTDKDNDKVKINGKPFVFLTTGVNVDFSNFKKNQICARNSSHLTFEKNPSLNFCWNTNIWRKSGICQ